jgi:hypothetical protein
MAKFAKLSDEAKDLGIGIGLGAGISGTIAGIRNDPSSLTGDLVAVTGQELIEYGVKKQFGKQATGMVAKQVGTTAAKESAKVVAKQVAQAAVKTTLTTTIKTAGVAAGRLASSSVVLMGGPIGVAILLISLTLGLLDIYWNPWKNYFNKDLDEVLGKLDEEAEKQYRLQGYKYPIQIKPAIIPETEEELEEFKRDVRQYFTDRNLVFPVNAFVNVKKRVEDYSQYRTRKYAISAIHKSILGGAVNTFQNKTFVDNWNELSDTANAMRAKNQFADQMSQFIYLRMTNEDIQTERTTLLLYTALLYKKGYILPPSERTLWVDIRQYLEVYWFRFIFYFLLIVVSIIVSCCLAVFYIK